MGGLEKDKFKQYEFKNYITSKVLHLYALNFIIYQAILYKTIW